ncbi:MAG: hypothetical protein PQJ46_02900 [Spirochaetales bacterium]|nr:hypothetical protein [Spirochaetales bacterium]
MGRFTTEDPIRDGLNWYAYANNNPLKFIDPTGLLNQNRDGSYFGTVFGYFSTGDFSRTGGIDFNLGLFSFSVGKDGLQIEVLDALLFRSYGLDITWGGPGAEKGINFNTSTLATDLNIGFKDYSLYNDFDILGFGGKLSVGQNTGAGVYWFLGEAYAGTDYKLVYSAISGGTYWNKDGTSEEITTCWNNNNKVIRFGGKYIGPQWTADGWLTLGYYNNDWDNWPVAYSMMDHAARIHDDIENWGDPDIEAVADMELRNNSINAFFFSSHASDLTPKNSTKE